MSEIGISVSLSNEQAFFILNVLISSTGDFPVMFFKRRCRFPLEQQLPSAKFSTVNAAFPILAYMQLIAESRNRSSSCFMLYVESTYISILLFCTFSS